MKNKKLALLIVVFVAATVAAHARTVSSAKAPAATAPKQTAQVFVPGNASVAFGNPIDLVAPFVSGITVDGPGTITVTYVDGTVDYGAGIEVGPNGGSYPANGGQYPLQEAKGFAPHTKINNMAALIGVFVPQSRVLRKGFNPIDGTKNAMKVGIMPGNLFFIGEGKTFDVKEAGTLFLGINDNGVADNGGGFNVEVTGP